MPTSSSMRRNVIELLGVKSVPRNARDRLLETAINLFYRHGFNTIGLDRVLAETGVTKTTFYKHFESKEDLVVAAIRTRDEWETRAWRRAVRKLAGDDPKAQLLGLFDVMDIWFNDDMYGGCIFLNAASEFPDPNDPAHQAAADHKRQAWKDVYALAIKARLRDPDRFTDMYTTLFRRDAGDATRPPPQRRRPCDTAPDRGAHSAARSTG